MLFNYLFLLMGGSILGYLLELFYRLIVKKRWIKPGVFKGVYLPLYGMGLCISYLLFSLKINFFISFILSIILMTFIELICGVIFIKYFKIPLWDYSDVYLNYKGLICLRFSLIWGCISSLFILYIFPYINFSFVRELKIIYFIFYFVMLIDVIYSLNKLLKEKRGNKGDIIDI